MIKIKVWKFYLKPNDELAHQKIYLYALTNKKELAKQFMKERNMDRFIIKTDKGDKEDVLKFMRDNNNRGAILDIKEIYTKSTNGMSLIISTEVPVLLTQNEYEVIKDTDIDYQMNWVCMPNYKMFNKKIRDALRYLEYNNLYDFNKYVSCEYTPYNPSAPDMPEYASPDLSIDELGIFLRTYRDTF